MARAFRDAKRYYGDQSGKKDKRGPSQYKPRENTTASSSKKEETPEPPKVKGEPTEVKMERREGSFKCYNCQKEGHIAKHCKEPRKERSDWKGKQKARAMEVNWKEVWEGASEEDCYSRPRSLCFHSKSLTQVLS